MEQNHFRPWVRIKLKLVFSSRASLVCGQLRSIRIYTGSYFADQLGTWNQDGGPVGGDGGAGPVPLAPAGAAHILLLCLQIMGPDYQTAEVKLRISRVASEKSIKLVDKVSKSRWIADNMVEKKWSSIIFQTPLPTLDQRNLYHNVSFSHPGFWHGGSCITGTSSARRGQGRSTGSDTVKGL